MSAELTFTLIKITIVLVVAGIAYGIFHVYFNNTPELETEQFQVTAELKRYHATAGVFRGRTGTYDGVCQGMLLSTDFSCDDTQSAFALEKRLTDGTYVCIDAGGEVSERLYSKGEKLECS